MGESNGGAVPELTVPAVDSRERHCHSALQHRPRIGARKPARLEPGPRPRHSRGDLRVHHDPRASVRTSNTKLAAGETTSDVPTTSTTSARPMSSAASSTDIRESGPDPWSSRRFARVDPRCGHRFTIQKPTFLAPRRTARREVNWRPFASYSCHR